MRIWQGLSPDRQKFHGGSVTIGKFDGLHLGHQKLLAAVAQGPRPHVVVTFNPLPLQVLQPEKNYRRLMPPADLPEQLPRYAVDLLQVLPFDRALAQNTAEEFAEAVLWAPFCPSRIVVGHDFAFGRGREGNLQWFAQWCAKKKVQLAVEPPFELDGRIVSSGWVRELIERGAVDGAARLLGRPFYLRGEVVPGAGRGRGIGAPTLNQKVVNETLPALGVYASRARLRGSTYASVTNVGVAPTFSEPRAVQVETHVLGQNISLYGESVDVELIQRLRAEKKFASVQDLKKQIEQDILEAKRALGGS